MSSTINWDRARADYVGDPTKTYQNIADKYGCSMKTVKKMGSREGWTAKRAAVSIRVDEKVVERAADQLVEVNERHTHMYKNMQALGLAELNIALNEIRRITKEAKERGEEVRINNDHILGQQRLKFLFDGLKVAMDGERITLGLPITVSVNKNEISGKDGNLLFEQVDDDDLTTTLARAIEAIGQDSTRSDSAKNIGTGQN